MDAVKFILEKERMCNACQCCLGCPMGVACGDEVCEDWETKHPAEAVALVEKWSEEHLRSTLADDFLKKCPDAELNSFGAPIVCAKSVYGSAVANCNAYYTCTECWNRPLSEVE